MRNGIKLGRKVGTAIRPRTLRSINPMSGILYLIRAMRRVITWRLNSSGGECIELGGVKREDTVPPRGHLAVYVGESDDETRRVVIPVVYFNNPLFGELLKEAERVYGFNHPGGISIPCEYSKFEKVKMRIDEWDGFRRRRRRHFYRRWGLVG